jgi:NAD(P)-dependent dehydrogenase (short-subunit alcohol dehydrogenase family)
VTISLAGKRALVSGSTSGIGFAIARGLAAAGAWVVVNGRNEERLAAATARLEAEVPEADVRGFAADLSQAAGVTALTTAIPEVEILVNNLGMFAPKPFFEITDEEWRRYFEVNVMTAVRLSRHYARGMVDRGWGRVLFNASVTGGFLQGEMAHYGATKTALLGLSRGLAESVAGTGVTVNAFLPGPTLTETARGFLHGAAEKAGKSFEEFEREVFGAALPDRRAPGCGRRPRGSGFRSAASNPWRT